MPYLALIAGGVIVGFIGLLALLVVRGMMTDSISLRGLINEAQGQASFSRTVLDNSVYQKARGFLAYSLPAWNHWVGMKSAKRLPGALAFLTKVREAGGRIAIVTDREQAVCGATGDNLTAVGIPFDLLLCKPPGGDQSKGARFKKIEDGTASPNAPPLRIVLWCGDNIRDFPGGDQGVTDDAFFASFGDRFFILPNPMYGSWLSLPRK